MADDETLVERLKAAWTEFRTCANELESRDYQVSIEGIHEFVDAPFDDELVTLIIHPPNSLAAE